MRAKRSKKYRKLMHQYELAFGFREPYQVLVDSNFLRAVHSFKMELIPALERTLQGKPKPLLTKCSLAAMMANQPLHPRTNNPIRPPHLPPPTEVPLRHCSHNADNTPIDETACLLSLLSPSTEANRNKEHYTLATADPPMPKESSSSGNNATGQKRKRNASEIESEKALRRAQTLRASARAIAGVPIVYVKRSVMVLEPMSRLSEGIREGYEMGKFRAGLSEPQKKTKAAGVAGEESKKKKKEKNQVKAPNPLSVKKPKKRVEDAPAKREGGVRREEDGEENVEEGEDSAPKPKRRRRHNKGPRFEEGFGGDGEGVDASGGQADAMEE
ncbi:hypothetical protein FE257_011279 [Aspergillus nanangensis]|uniref:rRNA processing protein n=1 Tax=Aspergillus nanangensis TaxID=2582783 RepID=A0AAD4CHL0_ASPNN|nr:hypothetical protein FE257_011279 [Aspergillus nanangensis]